MSNNSWLCPLAFLFLLVSIPAGVQAQGEADFERPDRTHQVKASCKSKSMPRNGYDIAERIPNSSDCWWVKDSLAQEIRSDIVDPGRMSEEPRPKRPEDLTFGPETTAQEAFAMAMSKHDATIRYVNLQRQDAERTFFRDSSACGTDVNCYAAAATALANKNAPLRTWEQDAERQLIDDIRRVGDYFRHREKN